MSGKKKPTLADDAHVSEHAKPHTAAAVAVLVEVMNSPVGTPHDATRVRAAEALLNRAWGRPPADHTVRVGEGKGQVEFRFTFADESPP